MQGSDPEKFIERITASVERGRSKETELLVRQAVDAGVSAEAVLRSGLLRGMRSVGALFKEDPDDIPLLLSAARSVRRGMQVLEPFLEKTGQMHIGKAILGTVEGDLHEVGKSLVAIMFRGAGFDVVDLGVDVSEKQFLRALREHPDASIVCVSSMLSTTNPQMKKIVGALRTADKQNRMKIMVGGASVTEDFAREIGADAYTENAVDAAEVARAFVMEAGRRDTDETDR